MEQASNTPAVTDTAAQVDHLNATYGDGINAGEAGTPSILGVAALAVGAASGQITGFTTPAPLQAGVFISPSVGRKVWYRPSKWDLTGPGAMIHGSGAPLDATVVAVHSDRCVNLVVYDQAGNQHKRLSVTLLQGADVPAEGTAYAEWMPYQKHRA